MFALGHQLNNDSFLSATILLLLTHRPLLITPSTLPILPHPSAVILPYQLFNTNYLIVAPNWD